MSEEARHLRDEDLSEEARHLRDVDLSEEARHLRDEDLSEEARYLRDVDLNERGTWGWRGRLLACPWACLRGALSTAPRKCQVRASCS